MVGVSLQVSHQLHKLAARQLTLHALPGSIDLNGKTDNMATRQQGGMECVLTTSALRSPST